MIAIPSISEEEKLNKSCAYFSPMVRSEALKDSPNSLEQAVRTTLNVDNALHGK